MKIEKQFSPLIMTLESYADVELMECIFKVYLNATHHETTQHKVVKIWLEEIQEVENA